MNPCLHKLIIVSNCAWFRSTECLFCINVHIVLARVNLIAACAVTQAILNRGSYMSAHVLLNLLNELGKRDKMRGLPSILSLFRNEFKNFNNTRA